MPVATLLANDSDADGDAITFASHSVINAQGGTLSLSNQWLFYVPPAGFTNSDTFTYTITDSWGATDTATVNLTIKTDLTPSLNLTLTPLGNGSYLLRFDGVPGVTYRIEYSTNLADWLQLSSSTANEFGVFEWVDTPPQGSPSRYYRSAYP